MDTIVNENKGKEYWLKRRKNNEAARRSREKRRMNDLLLERRVFQLTEENKHLRSQLLSIKIKYGELEDIKLPSSTLDSDLANTSYPELIGSQLQTINFEGLEGLHNRLQKEPDTMHASTSLTQKFTSQVITNATGDTSATVLVNSPDFTQKMDNLSSLRLGSNLSRIMSENFDESPDDENAPSFGKSPNRDHVKSALTTSSIARQDSQDEKDHSSRNGKEHFSHPTNTSARGLDENSFKSSSVPLNKVPCGPLDMRKDPVQPQLLSFFPNAAMLKLLQDHYLSRISGSITTTPSELPLEMVLQQFQVQFGNLNNAKLQSTCLPAETSKDKSLQNEFSVCETPRDQNDLICNPPILRHRSIDSGFGNEDKEIVRSSSPLSPPPSPERSLLNSYFPSRFFQDFRATGSQKKTEFRKVSSSSSIGSLSNVHEDEAVDIQTPKTSRSLSENSTSDGALDQSLTKKSEYQLPHKLRLKKTSVGSEIPAADNSPEVASHNFVVENPPSLLASSSMTSLNGNVTRCFPSSWTPFKVQEEPEDLTQKHRRFSVVNKDSSGKLRARKFSDVFPVHQRVLYDDLSSSSSVRKRNRIEKSHPSFFRNQLEAEKIRNGLLSFHS